MKERPIIFSGPMVCAILDGRKTMTRRVVKPQPSADAMLVCGIYPEDEDYPCPYGQPGDRLWVRETWSKNEVLPLSDRPRGEFIYRAVLNELGQSKYTARWRPSIFIPRWASRITLEITAVRVERVHDITEEDAQAEGVECPHRGAKCSGFVPPGNTSREPVECVCCDGYAPLFRELWDSINSKRGFGWDTNPWVWVVGFRRLT